MTTIVGGVILALLIAFFSSSSPELFLEKDCDSYLSSSSPTISLHIRNRGEVDSFASVCLLSQGVMLEKINNVNLSNISAFCFQEAKFYKKSTELLRKYDANLRFVGSSLPANFSVYVNSTCNTKVWGFIPKECSGIERLCTYKIEGSGYKLTS